MKNLFEKIWMFLVSSWATPRMNKIGIFTFNRDKVNARKEEWQEKQKK